LDVKKRFSEEQIIGFLKEADRGVPVKDLCRKHGFSDASFYLWRDIVRCKRYVHETVNVANDSPVPFSTICDSAMITLLVEPDHLQSRVAVHTSVQWAL
jgi:Transposase